MNIQYDTLPAFSLPALILAIGSVVKKGGETHDTVQFLIHRGIELGVSDEPNLTTDLDLAPDLKARVFFPGSRCGVKRSLRHIESTEPGLEKLIGRPVSFIYPNSNRYGYMVVWNVSKSEFYRRLEEIIELQKEHESAIIGFMGTFDREMEENVSV